MAAKSVSEAVTTCLASSAPLPISRTSRVPRSSSQPHHTTASTRPTNQYGTGSSVSTCSRPWSQPNRSAWARLTARSSATAS